MDVVSVDGLSAHRAAGELAGLQNGQPVGAGDPLLFFPGILWFPFAGWINVLGDRYLRIGVAVVMSFRGSERAVHGAIAKPEVKRFVLVLAMAAADVFLGPLGVVVGRVAFRHDGLRPIGLDQLVIEIVSRVAGEGGSVPDLLEVPVTSESVVHSGVPFPDLGGLVALLAKHRGPKRALLRIVCAAGVLALHPHGVYAVGLVAGEQGGPHGHAPSAHVAIREADAIFREGVDVGGIHPIGRFRVATD